MIKKNSIHFSFVKKKLNNLPLESRFKYGNSLGIFNKSPIQVFHEIDCY